jgi:hypothetical protein
MSRIKVAVVAAAVPLLPSLAAPELGAAGDDTAGRRVAQLESTSATAVVTFDAKDRPHVRALPGRSEVRARSGRVLRSAKVARTSLDSGASASASGYTCVNNRHRRGFVAYSPQAITWSTKAYYQRHLYHLYKQNRARRLDSRYRSKQWEACSVGGAHARGGNRLSRVVSMMTMVTRKDRLVGWKWDSGKEVPTARANLKFAVPIKPVTIEGSVDVHPTYTLTGSQGPDKQGLDTWDSYVHNQVNAIWEGSSTFRWQGSTHFQGNVGHALWELPQQSRTPEIRYSQDHERFCGRVWPIGCE